METQTQGTFSISEGRGRTQFGLCRAEKTKKEVQLIWVFTRYYPAEELRIFFHPMTDEQVPLRSLVLTHYRKAEFTDKLAEMCGYGLHNFRKVFKREFGMSP